MNKFLALPRYAFTRTNVQYAPEETGIYGLFDDDGQLVYIGKATDRNDHSIMACLLRHQDGVHGECTMKAKAYSWEVTLWPSARETEVLASFHQAHQRDPRCQSKAAA